MKVPYNISRRRDMLNLLRLAVQELAHDVARLLGLLRVDPVAAVVDGLERKPRELRSDLLEVDGADVARPLALDE